MGGGGCRRDPRASPPPAATELPLPRRPAPGAVPPDEDRISANVTMIGRDRKGVIARVTQALFETGGNIDALEEHVTRGTFHMTLQASWEGGRAGENLRDLVRERIQGIGDDLGMETRVRFHRPAGSQRLAIFVTREPHCLEGLLDAHEEGDLPVQPVLVVGNHEDEDLRGTADEAGLPYHHVPWDDADAAEDQALELLDEHDIDVIALARFMQILSPGFCYRFRNRILNIHPSLLPAFKGAQAYRQAYERGVRIVGVTAHFVTPDLDQGPIIAQDAFRVGLEDSLEEIKARGREMEAEVLTEAVDLYVRKRLDIHWGRVWEA